MEATEAAAQSVRPGQPHVAWFTGPVDYPVTPRTQGHRYRDRLDYQRETVHAILDEALICHVGFDSDGPLVLPMIHARVGEDLYLHLSTGSGLGLVPLPLSVCVTATIVDGLVFAKSQFNHSMDYRSVLVRGEAVRVDDPAERRVALQALVDHVAPGRSAQSRPAVPREDAATMLVRVPLAESSAKVRSGPPGDDAGDLELPYWSGVVPVKLVAGEPVPTDAAGPVPQAHPRFCGG